MLTRIVLAASLSLCSVLSFASSETNKYLKVEKLYDEAIQVSMCSKEQDQSLNCSKSCIVTKELYLYLTRPRTSDDAFQDGASNAAQIATYPVYLAFDNADAPFSILYNTLMVVSLPVGLVSFPFLLAYQYGKLGVEVFMDEYKLQTTIYRFLETSEKSHVYEGSPKAVESVFAKINSWRR